MSQFETYAIGDSYIHYRYAPSPDPLLSTVHYNRTHEQQEATGFLDQPTSSTEEAPAASPYGNVKYVPAGTTKLPHGSVGALGAHQAIAQGNTSEMSDAIFKYSAPEEVSVIESNLLTNMPYIFTNIKFICVTWRRNSTLHNSSCISLKWLTLPTTFYSNNEVTQPINLINTCFSHSVYVELWHRLNCHINPKPYTQKP